MSTQTVTKDLIPSCSVHLFHFIITTMAAFGRVVLVDGDLMHEFLHPQHLHNPSESLVQTMVGTSCSPLPVHANLASPNPTAMCLVRP
jgi:hypothetical protein